MASSSSSIKCALKQLDELISELEHSVNSSGAAKGHATGGGVENKKSKEKKGGGYAAGKSKENKQSDANATAAVAAAPLSVNALDLRVGVIRSVKKHETAEKLYCEEIDVGEEQPRAIASGLVPYYSLEEMQGRRLIAVCNLKPRNLVGFKSHGMVLCASSQLPDGSTKVEFVDPPADAKPGDRIVGEGLPLSEPLTASKCDKTKAFEVIGAELRVDANGIAHWQQHRLVCASGGEPCSTPTVRDALI